MTLPTLEELPLRQKQVCELVIKGLQNEEIGKELGIKTRTIKAHLNRLFIKYQIPRKCSKRVKLASLLFRSSLCSISTETQASQKKNLGSLPCSVMDIPMNKSEKPSEWEEAMPQIACVGSTTSSASITESKSQYGTSKGNMTINPVIAVTVAQEYCMPSYTQDGGVAVAFFKGMQSDIEFCIPVSTDAEAIQLATRFQNMFVKIIARYEELSK